jgi:hypothetical protein
MLLLAFQNMQQQVTGDEVAHALGLQVADGLHRIDCAHLTMRKDEETADRGHVGSAKYRSGNETLPSVSMRSGQLHRHCDADRARGDMEQPPPRLSMRPPSPNKARCTVASSDGTAW